MAVLLASDDAAWGTGGDLCGRWRLDGWMRDPVATRSFGSCLVGPSQGEVLANGAALT